MKSLLLLLTLFLGASRGGRIFLQPFSHCPNSHLMNFEKLAELLAEEHEVHMLVPTSYAGPYSSAHLGRVHLLRYPVTPDPEGICGFSSLDAMLDTPLLDIMLSFYHSSHKVCNRLLSERPLLARLKAMSFDLAIYDAVDPCCRLLADYLDVPFIVFHTQGLENLLPRHPAYLPCLLTSFTDQMGLRQRILNTAAYLLQKLITRSILTYFSELRTQHQLNATLPLAQAFDRAALRFILGDYGLDYVGPSQPSHILIGGFIQVAHPPPLDPALATFVNGGGEVLVVSLGSMVRHYGPHWREIFARALAQVPYRVVWRYSETEPAPTALGNNTLLLPWLPQAELLALPQTRVLVSHCGLNAVYEAAQHGVAVVGLPLYGDQFFQANKLAAHARMGVVLPDITVMTAESLVAAILEIHDNPSYLANARRTSQMLAARPFSQREQILRWTQHVLQLGGAPHLHSEPYYDMPWYQYFLCDIFLIASAVLLLICGLLAILLIRTLRFLRHQFSAKQLLYLIQNTPGT